MSRIPRALARRIDRLARRAHAFHRFAHHPLCAAYAGEVVRVGRRTLLCRGCLLAISGAAAGAVVALVAPTPHPLVLAPVLGVMAAAVPGAIARRAAGPRRSKLFTRAAPCATGAAVAALGLRAGGIGGGALALAALAIAVAAAILYRRRGPDRIPCRTCPELAPHRTCSGYRRMARREAAFSRLAGRLLRGELAALPGASSAEERAPPRAGRPATAERRATGPENASYGDGRVTS